MMRSVNSGQASLLVMAAALFLGSGSSVASTRILLILDSSGSMWGQMEGRTKIAVAKEVMRGVINDLPEKVELGFIAYGHRRKGDCDDIELLVPIGKNTTGAVVKQIQNLNPKGKTPITRAFKLALELLTQSEDQTIVLLVSDGRETCDEDPCKLIQAYRERGIQLKVHVVGFDVTDEEKNQLACIADAGGGQYFTAKNAEQLSMALTAVKTEVLEGVAAQTETPKSSFGNNAEGWKIVGDGSLGDSVDPTLENGAIKAVDHATGGVWYWKAPESFLGDKSQTYGLDLVFNLRTDFTDAPFEADDVVIKGAGKTIVADTLVNPGIDWTTYRVGLQESTGWMDKSDCRCVSRETLLEVLAKVEMLLIRGEFRDGKDTGWLDDVVFGASPAPAGEGAAKAVGTRSLCPAGAMVLEGPTTVLSAARLNFSFNDLQNFEDTAWIGIVPGGAPHGCAAEVDKHDVVYTRIRPVTAGTVTLHAPTRPGPWEARLLSSNKPGGTEVASVSFTVEGNRQCPLGERPLRDL